MPFDGTDFPRRSGGSGRAVRRGHVIGVLILLLAALMLFLPISAGAIVDISRYLSGH